MPEAVAVIVLCPAATADRLPLELTVATAALDDVHVADEVISIVEPSLYFAVAVSCAVWPAMRELVPATTIDCITGLAGEDAEEDPVPPQPCSSERAPGNPQNMSVNFHRSMLREYLVPISPWFRLQGVRIGNTLMICF
jgi:hypothetical protein